MPEYATIASALNDQWAGTAIRRSAGARPEWSPAAPGGCRRRGGARPPNCTAEDVSDLVPNAGAVPLWAAEVKLRSLMAVDRYVSAATGGLPARRLSLPFLPARRLGKSGQREELRTEREAAVSGAVVGSGDQSEGWSLPDFDFHPRRSHRFTRVPAAYTHQTHFLKISGLRPTASSGARQPSWLSVPSFPPQPGCRCCC